MASTIQLRIDENNGFPFEIKKKTANPYVTLTEDEFMTKLESSRNTQSRGFFVMQMKWYRI